MSRKAAQASVADQSAAPGGVAAVDRALSLLAAFGPGDAALGLAELAQRTQLYKSTVLRLLASLEHARLVQRLDDGRYALGREVARLHGLYTAAFSLEAQVMPVLRALVEATQESAALHVRQGDERLCLYRVDSPQPLRDHLRAGDVLPLARGAGGRVLRAFANTHEARGARGQLFDQIRHDGVAVLDGDRVAGLMGVAAPVFGAQGELVGALTLSLPSARHKAGHARQVREAAAELTLRLGGTPHGG